MRLKLSQGYSLRVFLAWHTRPRCCSWTHGRRSV